MCLASMTHHNLARSLTRFGAKPVHYNSSESLYKHRDGEFNGCAGRHMAQSLVRVQLRPFNESPQLVMTVAFLVFAHFLEIFYTCTFRSLHSSVDV